jgi:hypothetical protein
MGKSLTFDNQFLLLTFNAVAIANLADNAGTAPLTNLWIALHTADPGNTGNQSTNEVSYTGYARVAVSRDSAGWAVTINSCSPVAPITFGACTAGSVVATYFSVGYASTGATEILYSGPVTPNIGIATGVTPQLTTASTITET